MRLGKHQLQQSFGAATTIAHDPAVTGTHISMHLIMYFSMYLYPSNLSMYLYPSHLYVLTSL